MKVAYLQSRGIGWHTVTWCDCDVVEPEEVVAVDEVDEAVEPPVQTSEFGRSNPAL